MTKIEALKAVIEALKALSEALNEEYFQESSELKLEDVREVLAEISRSGRTAEMKSLLAKYGATKLSDIDPKYYAKLLDDAKEIANA